MDEIAMHTLGSKRVHQERLAVGLKTCMLPEINSLQALRLLHWYAFWASQIAFIPETC